MLRVVVSVVLLLLVVGAAATSMIVEHTYPSEALENCIEGSVTLRYKVSKNGRPQDVTVLKATPKGIFEAAAVEEVKRWQGVPNGEMAKINAHGYIETTLRFEIADKDSLPQCSK